MGMPVSAAGKGFDIAKDYIRFALPAAVIFMVFIAYPVAWIFVQSLTQTAAGAASMGTAALTLGNYAQILKDPVFWKVLKHMSIWACITIPVQMILGGVIAYFIETYTSRWRSFFRTMYFIPVVTSVSVVSIVWAQIYAPYYGIAQEYLRWMGIVLEDSFLGNTKTALYAVIVVNIWQWTGFSMLMYIAGLTNIPASVLEAAQLDGAKGLPFAVCVIAPMLAPVTKSLLLLGIIGTLQTFPVVFLMTNGGPNHATEVFGTYIFKKSFVIGDLGLGASLSIIVLAIAFVLSLVQIFCLGSSFGKSLRER